MNLKWKKVQFEIFSGGFEMLILALEANSALFKNYTFPRL